MQYGATAAAIARADVRRWWRSVVLVGLLAALVGGAVLALALGIRRSDTAYPRLVASSHSADVRVDLFGPGVAAAPRIRALPDVAAVVEATGALGRRAGSRDWMQVTSVDDQRLLDSMVVVRGRTVPPRSPDAVVVTERTARLMGVDIGDRVGVDLYDVAQFADVGRDYFVAPAGGRTVVRVVGIARDPSDAQVDSSAKVITAGPAFAGADAAHRAATVLFVRLRPGTGPAGFARRVIGLGGVGGANVHVLASAPASLRENQHTITVGLTICAVVLGLAGLLACGQTSRRRLTRTGDESRTLRALGTTRSDRVLAAVLALGPAAAIAALGAVVIAALASPLFPVGLLRDYEPSPGVAVNVAGLLAGALAVAVAVLVTVAVAALLAERTPEAAAVRRPGRWGAALVRHGVRPSVGLGVDLATARGVGRAATPLRSAFVGAVLAIAGVTAALGFGASLDRLVTTPARYGLDWDASVEINGQGRAITRDLAARRDVEAMSRVDSATIRLAGTRADVYALTPVKRAVDAVVVPGRAPVTDDEVALGRSLRRALHATVGGAVVLPGVDGPVRLRVVGESLPLDPQSERGLGGTLLVTPGAFRELVPADVTVSHEAAVRFAPGADRAAAVRFLRREHPGSYTDESRPARPTEVRDLAQLGSLPFVIGVSVLAVGVAALAHALVTAVRRRRRDLGVLRTIGFTRRQLATTVLVMAVAISLGALALGVPLGLVVARLVWGAVATGIDVAPGAVVPVPAIGAAAVGAVVVAVLAAWLPARAAARVRPAEALRGE